MASKMLKRDLVVKATTMDGRFRVCAALTTNVFQETLKRHSLNESNESSWLHERPEMAMQVQSLTADVITLSAMLASFHRAEERVQMSYHTGMGTISAESMALGEVRSYVGAPGEHHYGVLRVQRALYSEAKPVVSAVQCEEPDEEGVSLQPDAKHFFRQSDGIKTAVLLTSARSALGLEGESSDLPSGQSQFSGGVIVQPIAPKDDGPEEQYIEELQSVFDRAQSLRGEANPLLPVLSEGYLLGDLLALGTGNADVGAIMKKARHISRQNAATDQLQTLNALLGADDLFKKHKPLELNVDTIERIPLDFFCRCSKKDFCKHLKSMGKAEAQRIRDQYPKDGFFFRCQFCAKQETVSDAEWADILA